MCGDDNSPRHRYDYEHNPGMSETVWIHLVRCLMALWAALASNFFLRVLRGRKADIERRSSPGVGWFGYCMWAFRFTGGYG